MAYTLPFVPTMERNKFRNNPVPAPTSTIVAFSGSTILEINDFKLEEKVDVANSLQRIVCGSRMKFKKKII